MTTSAIELTPRAPLAVTNEQMTIARNTVAKGLDDDQFAVFLYNCQRQGVHPLDGLVIPIVRNDDGAKRLTFVTTVDMLRSRAAETDEYAGSDDAVFEYGGTPAKPVSAMVTVWRFVQGQKCSFTATARYDEYYPGDKQGFMWKSKPHVMLGKCAEGLALRKAFPKQLAGLYLEEELQKEVKPTRPRTPPPVGNVKCSECNAEGGHLPKCSKRQGVTKPEPVMCGGCGKMDGHAPDCQYAPKEAPAGKEFTKAAVLILSVEKLLKKADSKGKREPFVKLHVVDAANAEFDLLVWHQTPQQYLTAAVIDKPMRCEFSVAKKADNTTYRSLEKILEIAGVPYVDNKPAQQGAVEDDFDAVP